MCTSNIKTRVLLPCTHVYDTEKINRRAADRRLFTLVVGQLFNKLSTFPSVHVSSIYLYECLPCLPPHLRCQRDARQKNMKNKHTKLFGELRHTEKTELRIRLPPCLTQSYPKKKQWKRGRTEMLLTKPRTKHGCAASVFILHGDHFSRRQIMSNSRHPMCGVKLRPIRPPARHPPPGDMSLLLHACPPCGYFLLGNNTSYFNATEKHLKKKTTALTRRTP